MKRLMVAMFFMLLVGLSGESAYAFSDVKKSDYYYEAVHWGQQNKIISGFEDNTFRPNDKVTQRQFIKMYTNVFDFDKVNLKGEDYYQILEEYGIKFWRNDQEPIKRGEVALLLAYANGEIERMDYFNYGSLTDYDELEQAAKFLLENQISTGQSKGTTASKQLGVDNELTRAQAITFLHRLQQKHLNKLSETVKLYKDLADDAKATSVTIEFKQYADEHLQNHTTNTAHYYYSTDLNEDLISQYSTFFDEKMIPYTEQLFPLVKTNTSKPTFVFLGNEFEQSTIKFAEKFYGNGDTPFGWYSSMHNITVMTQRSYSQPYNKINTILLPHEYFHWLKSNVYKSNIPSWLNEGIAYNMSWAMYDNTTNFMEASLYKKYKSLLITNDNPTITDSRTYMVVTAYLQAIYGQKKLEDLLIRSASEKFENAFKDIYGKSVDDMVKETKDYVTAN